MSRFMDDAQRQVDVRRLLKKTQIDEVGSERLVVELAATGDQYQATQVATNAGESSGTRRRYQVKSPFPLCEQHPRCIICSNRGQFDAEDVSPR